jgi:hypothetical protein
MPNEPSPTSGSPGKRKPKPKPATQKQKFIWAEETQESGHNYKAVNPNSGALGIAQIMPANLPGWAKECGLQPISPQGFLDNPKYQDQMVWCILGGYYDTYGAAGAAAMWYSGQPNPNEDYGQPSVRDYVNSVLSIMRNAPNVLPSGYSKTEVLPGGSTLTALGVIPPVGDDSWAHSIKLASNSFRQGTMTLSGQAKNVSHLTVKR